MESKDRMNGRLIFEGCAGRAAERVLAGTEGQHHTERQEHPSSVQSHRPELHVGIAVLLDQSENSSPTAR